VLGIVAVEKLVYKKISAEKLVLTLDL